MTRDQVIAEIHARNNTDDSDEEQLRWIVSLHRATEISEWSLKDVARELLYEGFDKTGEEEIVEWLEDWENDGALIAFLDEFYKDQPE